VVKPQYIALCTWCPFDGAWFIPDGEPATQCRASVGEKIVTVWLPKGAMIRLRRARWGDVPVTEQKFCHYYGRPGNRTRIDIKILVDDSVNKE
jgi:hypothetical protein